MAKKKIFNISSALSSGLEETIAAGSNYSGELHIEVIPIKKIETDPDNPRDLLLDFNDLYQGILHSDPHFSCKMQEKESLASMAASIKQQGIINPIVVYKYGEKYRLIAGERRTFASILIGKSDIQAKILDSKPSELKIGILQWIENIERSDLSLWERLRNLEKIVTAYTKKNATSAKQMTITELSHLIGCSKPHAMNYKAVLTADSQIKNLIQNNKLKNLEKAAFLAGVDSPSIQQAAIIACLEGAQLKKLKTIVHQKTLAQKLEKKTSLLKQRGRQSMAVHFGTTKNKNVAKKIIDAILKDAALNHLIPHFSHIDWNDYQSMTHHFKQIIKKLEELAN